MSDISLSDEDAFPKAGDVEVVVEFKFGRNLVLTRNPQKVEVEKCNRMAVSSILNFKER